MKITFPFIIFTLTILLSCTSSKTPIVRQKSSYPTVETPTKDTLTATNLNQYKDYDQIIIENSSFELDQARHSTIPTYWTSCGNALNSPPDVHSDKYGFFGVTTKPIHGHNFLGLVGRIDDTHESISQEISETLQPQKTYLLGLFLAQSQTLKSGSNRHSKEYVAFNKPAVLKIWGGSYTCHQEFLLHTTPLIDHKEWRFYSFKFTPTSYIDYLTFEVSYLDAPAYSNILIDGISPIINLSSKLPE